MKKLLKKHLIAGKHNNGQPHILRDAGIISLSYLALIAFLLVLLQAQLFGPSSFLASILPNVLVDLANADRGEANLGDLRVNSDLVKAAQMKANDMAKNGYFAHTSPDGIEPWYWFKQAGYDYLYAGENLAINFSDSEAVDDAWMASPGHRANILGRNFTEIGIASAIGEIDGKETIFVVQMFGRPKSFPLAIASESPAPDLAEFETEGPTFDLADSQVLDESEVFVETNEDSEILSPSSRNKPVGYLYKLASSPSKALQYLYILIGLLLLVAIFTVVRRQFKVHHLKQVLAGGALMALMSVLFISAYSLLFLQVQVL